MRVHPASDLRRDMRVSREPLRGNGVETSWAI
jgi:hypothetical protein